MFLQTMMLRPSQKTLVVIFCLHVSFHCHSVFADGLTYEQHIRPIFRAHCFDCHGATEDLEGELDLRQVRLMKRGGVSGPVIELKEPGSSLLLTRIQDGEMPPGEVKVSAEEIEVIRHWIQQGAPTARPEAADIGMGLALHRTGTGLISQFSKIWLSRILSCHSIKAGSEIPLTCWCNGGSGNWTWENS